MTASSFNEVCLQYYEAWCKNVQYTVLCIIDLKLLLGNKVCILVGNLEFGYGLLQLVDINVLYFFIAVQNAQVAWPIWITLAEQLGQCVQA